MLRSLKIWIAIFFILAGIIAGSAASARGGITPSQKEQLKGMASDTKRDVMRERDNLKRARKDLFKAYQSYNIDEKKAKSALDKISQSQLDLLTLHLNNQKKLRDVLNEDQFQEFQQIIQNHRHGGMMPPLGEMIADNFPDKKMLDSIDISDAQEKQIRRQMIDGPQKMRIVQKLRRDSRQMIEIYSNYKLDEAAAKKLINSIHQDQQELAMIGYRKQQAVHSVLTPEQFDKLKDQMDKRFKDGRNAPDDQ